jgi:hypothetical protein
MRNQSCKSKYALYSMFPATYVHDTFSLPKAGRSARIVDTGSGRLVCSRLSKHPLHEAPPPAHLLNFLGSYVDGALARYGRHRWCALGHHFAAASYQALILIARRRRQPFLVRSHCQSTQALHALDTRPFLVLSPACGALHALVITVLFSLQIFNFSQHCLTIRGHILLGYGHELDKAAGGWDA